jgi:flavodoxin
MKALVAYYSRTGMTKRVAEAIAKGLDADIEEIIDMKDRKGPKGYMIACKDAVTKQLTEIKNLEKDPSLYEIFIVGTPVWAFTTAPAIRTYLTKKKQSLKKVAFFCTLGGSGSEQTFKDMEALCEKKPDALLKVTTAEVRKGRYVEEVKEFVEELNKTG